MNNLLRMNITEISRAYHVRNAFLHVAVKPPGENSRGAAPSRLAHHLLGAPCWNGTFQALHHHALGADCRGRREKGKYVGMVQWEKIEREGKSPLPLWLSAQSLSVVYNIFLYTCMAIVVIIIIRFISLKGCFISVWICLVHVSADTCILISIVSATQRSMKITSAPFCVRLHTRKRIDEGKTRAAAWYTVPARV